MNMSPLHIYTFNIANPLDQQTHCNHHDLHTSILLAVAVFFVLSVLYAIRTYYAKQQERIRAEKERWDKAQEEAHRAHEDAEKAEMDR